MLSRIPVLLLLAALIGAVPSLAQTGPTTPEEPPGLFEAKRQVVGALMRAGVPEAFGENVRFGAGEETVWADVVLTVVTDDAGAIRSVSAASAPPLPARVEAAVLAAVEPLVLPSLPAYEGPIAFSLSASSPPEPSPWITGLAVGASLLATLILMEAIR